MARHSHGGPRRHSSLTTEIVAKIVSVVPKSYLLRQELIKDRQLGEGQYELVILPSRPDRGWCTPVSARDPRYLIFNVKCVQCNTDLTFFPVLCTHFTDAASGTGARKIALSPPEIQQRAHVGCRPCQNTPNQHLPLRSFCPLFLCFPLDRSSGGD